MIEALCLTAIGIPLLFVAFLIWGCCTIAVFDAISAFRAGREGSKRIRKLMARRWPE